MRIFFGTYFGALVEIALMTHVEPVKSESLATGSDVAKQAGAIRDRGGESDRSALEPMDPQLTDIQPGGGVVKSFELGWGAVRRTYLRTFRQAYIVRMQSLRKGDQNRCPHDVLDPRDIKFYQNQAGYYWDTQDDPFAWRDRLPFARIGLAELIVFLVLSLVGLAASAGLAVQTSGWQATVFWLLVATFGVIGVLIVWFFRDPTRTIPQEPGLVVAPADGKIVDIRHIEDDEWVGGPAVAIGVFLSIFSVHLNRVPVGCRVIGLRYRPGKYLNALRPESARENEQLAVHLEQTEPPFRRMVVRQIAGAIARRIVCWVKPGDELIRGDRFGMIKLGSRTELVLPDEPGLQIRVQPGDTIRAGATIVAAYEPCEAVTQSFVGPQSVSSWGGPSGPECPEGDHEP